MVTHAVSLTSKKLSFPTLKLEQQQIVEVFLKGRDVFVSLPTGNGKSLCYSILFDAIDIPRDTPARDP